LINKKDNEIFKTSDQSYWAGMIKEVDKNGDGEVFFFILILMFLIFFYHDQD